MTDYDNLIFALEVTSVAANNLAAIKSPYDIQLRAGGSRMRSAVLASAVGLMLLGNAASAHADWAAAVWSPRTGAYGTAYGYRTERSALNSAKSGAGYPANPVVATVQNGHCLIISDQFGRYAWGVGSTYAQALAAARKVCPLGQVRAWASSP